MADRPRGGMRRDVRRDDGAALVDFIGLTLVLLVPLVYLIVALARVQAGIFAAESAADEAARATVVAGVAALESGASTNAAMAAGVTRARAGVALTAEDFGFAAADASLTVACEGPCLADGGNIATTVTFVVALPGIPGFVSSVVPLEVEVAGSARAPVDSVAVDR